MALAAVTVAAAACASNNSGSRSSVGAPGGAGTANSKTYSTSLFLGDDPVFAPAYVAAAEGFFKAHHVNVDEHIFTSGALAIQAIKAANAGFVVAGDLPTLTEWSKNQMVSVLPVTRDYNNVEMVASPTLKSASQIKGKTIATVVGSTDQLALDVYLQRLGLSQADVHVINLTGGSMVAALRSNEIQAFMWIYAIARQALHLVPGSHLLLSNSKGLVEEQMVLSAAPTTITQDPGAVSGVVAAFLEADQFIQAHPNKAASDVAATLRLPLSEVKVDMQQYSYDPSYDSEFVNALNSESQFSVHFGLKKSVVAAAQHFDGAFLKAVAPSDVQVAYSAK